ncbi:MAG: sodium-dependent bicarbonate transport family permease [Desulfitobacteriaceae bacterium]
MLAASSLLVSNLLSPMVLFFALGAVAVLVKSDMAVPREVTTGLALYLMMAIGFHGGAELSHAGLSPQVIKTVLSGAALGLVLPGLAFLILTRIGRLDPVNAGAIAAHYGSISAVTFATASSFLSHLGIPYQGFMVAVMALMEGPGAVVGILLARTYAPAGERENVNGNGSLGSLLKETILGGSVLLLLGSFAIGAVTGEKGMGLLKPFVVDLFPGALSLFLLDMGLTAARRLDEFLRLGKFLTGFAIIMPLVGGSLGLLTSRLIGLSIGDATLLAVLAASASYIAAPAAVRLALPRANPSLSITLVLGVTFPFNILIGIPLYYTLARAVIRF